MRNDKMLVSCLPISLFSLFEKNEITIKKWAELARDLGYDGIDISIMFLKNHTPVYLNEIKRHLAEENMSIIMATSYPDFTNPSYLQRERELEYFKRDIAVCSALGIQYLRILDGQDYPEENYERQMTNAVNYMLRSQECASKYGIDLLFEDHAKPSAWDRMDFSFPTKYFLDICERIKDSSIGINFDTGNIFAYGDEPLPVLKKVYNQVKTIHVSDMKRKGVFSPSVIGEGSVPLHEVFSFLKQNMFQGWFCIEEASNTGIEGIERAIRNVRNIYDECL